MLPLNSLLAGSGEFLWSADVLGTVGFSAAVAADNGRLVSKTFDAIIVFFGLEGTHMHFVLFDITSHVVLLVFCKLLLVVLVGKV